jgi:hypothetical protein
MYALSCRRCTSICCCGVIVSQGYSGGINSDARSPSAACRVGFIPDKLYPRPRAIFSTLCLPASAYLLPGRRAAAGLVSTLHRATDLGCGPGCGPGCEEVRRPRSGWPGAGALEFETPTFRLRKRYTLLPAPSLLTSSSGLGRGQTIVSHNNKVLKFESIARADKPGKRTVQRGWGTRGVAFARCNKAFTGTPALFPHLRSFSVIPLSSLTRIPTRLPACWLPLRVQAPHDCFVLKTCLRVEMSAPPPAEAGPPLPSVSSVLFSSAASGLSAVGPRCQGRRR